MASARRLAAETRRMERVCKQCGVPIWQRSGAAVYCLDCSNQRQRESAERARARKRAGLPPKKRYIETPYLRLAHQYVSEAVRRGDLPRLDGSIACVDCGAAAEHYDHRDYCLPLQVDPVCRTCNFRRGKGRHGHDELTPELEKNLAEKTQENTGNLLP